MNDYFYSIGMLLQFRVGPKAISDLANEENQ